MICTGHALRVTGYKVSIPEAKEWLLLEHAATHCKTLQHTATHCNILQHMCNRVQSKYTGGERVV